MNCATTPNSVAHKAPTGPRLNDPRPSLLRKLEIPFLVHGRMPEPAADYAWLDMDNIRAFRRATEFLLDLGHQKIALITGHESMDFARRRRIGFKRGCARMVFRLNPR